MAARPRRRSGCWCRRRRPTSIPATSTPPSAAVDGVAGVHDLHVWTLTSEMDVVTAHLAVDPSTDGQRVLAEAQRVLATRFGLTHATLQVETSDPCDHPDW